MQPGRGVTVGEIEWTGAEDGETTFAGNQKRLWLPVRLGGECNLVLQGEGEFFGIETGRCALLRVDRVLVQWRGGSRVRALYGTTVFGYLRSARLRTAEELLNARSVARQRDWQETGSGCQYGFGVVNFQGVLGHNGQVPGYSAFAGHDTLSGFTVIVLANQYADSKDRSVADEIAWVILGHLNRKDYRP